MIDKAASSNDTPARMKPYRQIRTIVSADAPLVFTHCETFN